MKCFHGTTTKGYNAITKGGTESKPCSPWTVSDEDGCLYVWPQNKLEESYAYEDINQMIIHAFESSEIQAVFTQDRNLFVLELEIPDELLEDDYSCENMSDVASFIDSSNFDKNMIVKVYKCDFNIWKSPFIVKSLLCNVHFNKWSIDEDLLQVAENLCEDYYYEREFDWYEINHKGCINV